MTRNVGRIADDIVTRALEFRGHCIGEMNKATVPPGSQQVNARVALAPTLAWYVRGKKKPWIRKEAGGVLPPESMLIVSVPLPVMPAGTQSMKAACLSELSGQ